MKRVTINLPDDLVAYLERKKAQLKRQMPSGKEEKVSTSAVIEGILSFWRAVDSESPPEQEE